jgi:hypothetical protein
MDFNDDIYSNALVGGRENEEANKLFDKYEDHNGETDESLIGGSGGHQGFGASTISSSGVSTGVSSVSVSSGPGLAWQSRITVGVTYPGFRYYTWE